MVSNLKDSMQTMTAFDFFKTRRLKRRLKASIPYMQKNSNVLHDFLYFAAFTAASVQLKKPQEARRALSVPHAMGLTKGEKCNTIRGKNVKG
jgi:hypothetical protein